MTHALITGSCVAIVTPMRDDKIDYAALKRMVNWQIEQGTSCIVPVGTTGESPTMTRDEHLEIIKTVVEVVNGRVAVMAGSGSNNTREAVDYHQQAKALGADAALHVCGYYNRPSQEGIYQHFKVLNDSCDIPIYVYNIPPRAVIDISVDTMKRLSDLPHVVGVKDATGDVVRPARERLQIGSSFSWLSGEDGNAVAYNASGGNGCISVTANVAPALCAKMQNACLAGNYPEAMAIQQKLLPLHDALFVEPSPAGVKYAASLLGLCEAEARLPVVELTNETKARIERAVKDLGLTGISESSEQSSDTLTPA